MPGENYELIKGDEVYVVGYHGLQKGKVTRCWRGGNCK